MSGPITVGFLIAPGVVALAEEALREARAMKREYGDVLAQLRRREAERARSHEHAQAARHDRMAGVRESIERDTARLERLRAIAGAVPALASSAGARVAAAPASADEAAWAAHAQALRSAVSELEQAIAAAGDAQAAQAAAALSRSTQTASLDDVLRGYVLERRARPGLDPAQSERFRETAARVLARLPRTHAVPPELEGLAREIILAPSVDRAEALALELRHAVQRIADADAAGHSEREHAAAAYVLQESLRDLGYEVEDIEATLFADGGLVHFTRRGWESYYVRMRVNAADRTANFNVVRASGAEDTAERRRIDALAEDRWCAEFPRLMETLAARGITLDVMRRLEAGAVPVQVVDPASLPAAANDDQRRAPGKLKAKPLR